MGDGLIAVAGTAFDAWEFYYPYDQRIDKTSPLLAKAINEVLETAGFSTPRSNGKVHIVGHSMGGLVTRDLLLSPQNYGGNIGKFLILGTPNHGSYGAYRKYEGDILSSVANFLGKGGDEHAPAFYQLAIASEYMYDLNVDRPAQYQNFSYLNLVDEMLVIAGTDGYLKGFHSEIEDQDDGVVAVASTNMLEEGVPLVTVDLAHTDNDGANIKVQTGPELRSFMVNEDYLSRPAGTNFTSVWTPQGLQFPASVAAIPFVTEASIFTMRFQGANQTINFAGFDLDDLHLNVDENNSVIFVRDESGLGFGVETFDFQWANTRLGPTANYFAKAPRSKNVGFDVAEGTYRIDFTKLAWPDEVTYKVINDGVTITNMQTTMADVLLSTGEFNIFNADDYLAGEAVPGKNGQADRQYLIDAGVDQMVIVLSNAIESAPFDFVLTNPIGEVIDPVDAGLRVGYEYKENTDAGFAFYYVPRRCREYGRPHLTINSRAPGSMCLSLARVRSS